MAVIDQHPDDFSNVSWHTEQPSAAESSSSVAAANPDETDRNGHSALDSDAAEADGREVLECTVSEPLKENDGSKDTFVSYLITTNVRQSKRSVAMFYKFVPAGSLRSNPTPPDHVCDLSAITCDSSPTIHGFRLLV